MRSMTLLVAFSLCGCAGVPRPDAYINGFNAKSQPMKIRGYNIRKDFNDDGSRKKNATPREIVVESCQDLNGYMMQSPADFEKSLVYLKQMRQAYNDLKKSCGK